MNFSAWRWAIALALLLCFTLGANGWHFRAVPGTGLFTKPKSSSVNSQHLFHGINVVHKGPGFRTITAADVDFLFRQGFNVVRFGFLWYNMEVSPGVYNESYIASMKAQVALFEKYGIAVFLDLHQDCYSPFFCNTLQDGVPLFYGAPPNSSEYWHNGSRAFPQPLMQPEYENNPPKGFGPWGKISNCAALQRKLTWAACYPTFALGAAIQRLYDNDDSLQEHLGRLWKRVATEFSSFSNIIGYELMNEPFLGKVPLTKDDFSPVKNPKYWDLWFDGNADKRNLSPMYDYLAEAIRSVDPFTPIFFEPASGGSLIEVPSGFPHGPGGPQYDKKGLNVLSYHIYCPLVQVDFPIPTNGSNALWNWIWKMFSIRACDSVDRTMIHVRSNDTVQLGVGGFLTEFGAIPNSHRAADIMEEMLSLMDQTLHSWTFWEIDGLESAVPYIKNTIARSYPQVTPGRLLRYGTTNAGEARAHARTYFWMEFLHDSAFSLSSSCLVFLNPSIFGANGTFTVQSFPPNAILLQQFDLKKSLLEVKFYESLTLGDVVRLEVYPSG